MPLNDLAGGRYLGQFEGGLYPDGSNAVPAAHAAVGLAGAGAIVPRNASGEVDAAGKYVLLSIGMSNTTQEFSTFVTQAAADPRVNHGPLVIVDGAAGGQSADTWDSPAEANYDRVRDQVLAPRGLTEAQVEAAWVKVANPGPTTSLPAADADAYTLLRQMGDITRALKDRYPNLSQVFFSSRIYGGYATTSLNPEPYAYESGFAVKWMIEAQIRQEGDGSIDPLAGDVSYDDGDAPWIAWGPYLWADGLNARSDGLTWQRSDFVSDGTHPSTTGRQKVASMLMEFMLDSPFTRPWFAGAVIDPPHVTQVFVNGPGLTGGNVTADRAAFRSAAGIDPTYGYPVPAGADQLKAVPWMGGVNRIAVRFDTDVQGQVGRDDLQVRRADGTLYDFSGFRYDPDTRTAAWTLAQTVTNDALDLVIASAGLLNLDGEWIQGGVAETYPSGDGTPGGDFVFRVNVLAGDASRDGRVNALDLAFVRQRLNRTASDPDAGAGGAAYSPFADVTADGHINALDLAAVRQRLNSGLPPVFMSQLTVLPEDRESIRWPH
jgi:hypothetical protein